jgi:hypothetical protein
MGEWLSHLTLLLQVGGTRLVGLSVGLLLLEDRLGNLDRGLGGNTGAHVSNAQR